MALSTSGPLDASLDKQVEKEYEEHLVQPFCSKCCAEQSKILARISTEVVQMAAQEDSKPRSSSVLLELNDSGIIRTLLLREGSAAADSGVDKVALRADYQSTVEIVKLLTDIRFRCLVFVTAVIAIANALFPNNALPGTKITFAFVGFLTTLGIATYELRNSQLYESAIHRAKVLEAKLEVEKSSSKAGPGLFNERPPYVSTVVGLRLTDDWKTEDGKKPKLMRFVFVPVQHDQGLALIYGAVLGGWFYLIAYGVASLIASQGLWPGAPSGWVGVSSGALGFLAFLICWRWFIRHDNTRFKLKPPNHVS